MKVFSAEQIRICDTFTIESEDLAPAFLMDRAASKCVEFLTEKFKKNPHFYIFCGPGNNGGDGFAIAEKLYGKGFNVNVFLNSEKINITKEAKIFFNRIREISGISIKDFDDLGESGLPENVIIIDSVFGTGLNRSPQGKYKAIIDALNRLPQTKVAIDIPSGLSADENLAETVFQADETLSFQFWKKSFLHPETGKVCGNVHLLDIGLSEKIINELKTDYYTVDENLVKNIYKPRPAFSHKGTFGKSVIAAGSFGKIGAAVLATKAAMKTGSGLTFTLAPKCGYEILQSSCPEAMYLFGGRDFISEIDFPEDAVLGIGPGLGTDPETQKCFLDFLERNKNPLVIDADALNILSLNKDYLKLIPQNSIITPHPKEFDRLFGESKNSFERLNLAREKAAELKFFIVLKDHFTQIITPKKEVFYNTTGNSGMAKGGSGDVLTGILTSLLGQQYSSKDAALFAVWLHGKAGDFAAEKYSKEAMLPSDLISEIGSVFKLLTP